VTDTTETKAEGKAETKAGSTPGSSQLLSGAEAGRLMRLATYASVCTAAVLIAVKLVAWWLTDSLAMLSSLVDSMLDIAAALVTLMAVRHALSPADSDHRFGHGKAEPLAALAQAGLITGSAFFLMIEAMHRFLHPAAIENTNLGVGVMLFSMVLTFALTRFQAYVVRKTQSVAISADSLHYVSDILMNAAVIVALLVTTHLDFPLADPLIGLGIAVWIVRSAWQIARVSYDMLMDRELPDEDREKIIAIARRHPEVLGVHDLRTRASGPNTFIQMHLEIPGGMTLYRAHAIADTVEAELQTAFPDAEVLIHQDPHAVTDKEIPSFR